MTNRDGKLETWRVGLKLGLRIYGACIITSFALLPLFFTPENETFGAAWLIFQIVYFVVVAPYAFCRSLKICGLAIRVLNQGPVNSATRRKNEALKLEVEGSKSRTAQNSHN